MKNSYYVSNLVNENKNMIFYDIMWYNYPDDKKYFSINEELTENIKHKSIKEKKLISDTTKQENIINKYHFLYNKIPFIEHIYIANSLTFKSIHKNSDIDLFIITKDNKIFLAKLFVWLFLKLFWMYWNHQNNKFCIWFYITSQSKDLYPISISWIDLYLAYWIAHLQNLYSEKKEEKDNIFKENLWVKNIIPNYNQKEKNILNIKKTYWSSLIKRILENIFWFDTLNTLLWMIWKKKMEIQRKKLWKDWKNMIISDNILKFHAPDIRKIVYLKYKILKNTPKKKIKTNKTLF